MAWVDCGAGVYKTSTEGDVLTGTFFIDFVSWAAKGVGVGSDLLLQDGDGNDILIDYTDSANYHDTHRIEGVYTNPTATTLDGGTIYMKTRKDPSYFTNQ